MKLLFCYSTIFWGKIYFSWRDFVGKIFLIVFVPVHPQHNFCKKRLFHFLTIWSLWEKNLFFFVNEHMTLGNAKFCLCFNGPVPSCIILIVSQIFYALNPLYFSSPFVNRIFFSTWRRIKWYKFDEWLLLYCRHFFFKIN